MFSRVLLHWTVFATSIQFGSSQKSVPADLSTDFTGDPKLQVSYTGNAVDGFIDGTTFSQAEVENEPTFALGDSSGITPGVLYTILLLDTTNSTRTLHYARSNFQTTGDVVEIATDDDALFAYKAPGTLGETGEAKYTFLMYINPARRRITQLKLPIEGRAFDAVKFQEDNGFKPAVAGLAMAVVQATVGNNSDSTSSVTAPSSSSVFPSRTSLPLNSLSTFPTPTSAARTTEDESVTSTIASLTTGGIPTSTVTSPTPSSSSSVLDGLISVSITPTALITSAKPDATEVPTSSSSPPPAIQTDSGAVSSLGRTPWVVVTVVGLLIVWLV